MKLHHSLLFALSTLITIHHSGLQANNTPGLESQPPWSTIRGSATWEKPKPLPPQDITFTVDMSGPLEKKEFDPTSGKVKVLGQFNNWSPTENTLDLTPVGNNLYTGAKSFTLPPSTPLEYKFYHTTPNAPNGGYEPIEKNRSLLVLPNMSTQNLPLTPWGQNPLNPLPLSEQTPTPESPTAMLPPATPPSTPPATPTPSPTPSPTTETPASPEPTPIAPTEVENATPEATLPTPPQTPLPESTLEAPTGQSVTFTLDMSQEVAKGTFTNSDTLQVVGDFNNWSTSEGTLPLTLSEKNTYTGTGIFAGPTGSTVQYKFHNKSPEAPNAGFEETSENRKFQLGNPNDLQNLPTATWAGSTPTPPTNITAALTDPKQTLNPYQREVKFTVNMNPEISKGTFDERQGTVTAVGDFNGWSTEENPVVLHPIGNGLYSGSAIIAGSTNSEQEYKFRHTSPYAPNFGFEEGQENRTLILGKSGAIQNLPVTKFGTSFRLRPAKTRTGATPFGDPDSPANPENSENSENPPTP